MRIKWYHRYLQEEGFIPNGVQGLPLDLCFLNSILRDCLLHHGFLSPPRQGAVRSLGLLFLMFFRWHQPQQTVGVTEAWRRGATGAVGSEEAEHILIQHEAGTAMSMGNLWPLSKSAAQHIHTSHTPPVAELLAKQVTLTSTSWTIPRKKGSPDDYEIPLV